MSEAYAEPLPADEPVLSPEASAALAEEQQLTDNAEQAIAALLLALLLSNAAPSMIFTTPAALRDAIDPVMKPLLLSLGLIMLRRSSRRGSTEDWDALMDRTLDDAVSRLTVSMLGQYERTNTDDIYKRSDAGPAGPPAWAKQVSHTIVTAVTEGFKAGLSYRLGFHSKQWVTREDSRVRDTHRHLHGMIIPRTAKFATQSGAFLDRPGDRTAPIGEWINCRCDLIWLRGRHA